MGEEVHHNHSRELSAKRLSCCYFAVQVIHLDVKSKVGLLGVWKSCRVAAMLCVWHMCCFQFCLIAISSTLKQLHAVHAAAAHLL